jgi:hypothetical protein
MFADALIRRFRGKVLDGSGVIAFFYRFSVAFPCSDVGQTSHQSIFLASNDHLQFLDLYLHP